MSDPAADSLFKELSCSEGNGGYLIGDTEINCGGYTVRSPNSCF